MIDAAVLADRADEVFAAAPLLRHVALTGLGAVGRTPGPDPLPVLRAALEHLAGIAGLHVDSIGDLLETGVTGSPYTFASVETEGFALVLASGVLASARSLSLPQVPSPTVAALVGSGSARGHPRFASANGTASTFALVAQMPALRALELRLERGYPAVFPPLEELRVADLTDDALAALAASPAAATLERLSLRNVRVDRGLAALAKLPRRARSGSSRRPRFTTTSTSPRCSRPSASPRCASWPASSSRCRPRSRSRPRSGRSSSCSICAARRRSSTCGATSCSPRSQEISSPARGSRRTRGSRSSGASRTSRSWDMPLIELPRILLAK